MQKLELQEKYPVSLVAAEIYTRNTMLVVFAAEVQLHFGFHLLSYTFVSEHLVIFHVSVLRTAL